MESNLMTLSDQVWISFFANLPTTLTALGGVILAIKGLKALKDNTALTVKRADDLDTKMDKTASILAVKVEKTAEVLAAKVDETAMAVAAKAEQTLVETNARLIASNKRLIDEVARLKEIIGK